MNNAIFSFLLLTGMFFGVAQADLILTNNLHISQNVNQRETYFINVLSGGSDNIFIQSSASTTPGFNGGDIFMDGFLSVWQQVGSNWTLIGENDQAPRAGAGNTGGAGDTGPTTIYGQNVLGYAAGVDVSGVAVVQNTSGLADPGLTLNLLANTQYMIVESAGGAPGLNDKPTLSIGQSIAIGTPLQNFFAGQDDLSGGTGTPYYYTNSYTLDVTGNVQQTSAPILPATPVPVPTVALWGLGFMLAICLVMKRQPDSFRPNFAF